MVLKGQRLPSQEMVSRLSRQFAHNETEHRYFELLVELDRKQRRKEEFSETLKELKSLSGNRFDKPTIDSRRFSFIADWYHLAIKQLIQTPAFRPNIGWIRTRLRNAVTPSEIRDAIDRMVSLGIIERSKTGKLTVREKNLKTTEGVQDKAIRRHHFGMISRALDALRINELDNQEFTSLTLRIDPQNIAQAKAAIRNFRDQFNRQFDSESSNSVYQLNFQLFEHTHTKQEKQ